jgi:hypothetical protein
MVQSRRVEGKKIMKKDFRKFYLQWYWQEALMYPYEKTKAYYHGPREKWMKLVEDK